MTTNIITKKFVPCIYLYRGYAVKSLKDLTIVDTDPLRLARYYSEHNADELILFDLSEQAAKEDALKNAEAARAADGVGQAGINNADALHEEALDLMKFQNAYNLASKCISVVADMYDQLILNTGV